MSFRALVSTQGADRKVTSAVETLDESKLPAGDVTVAVEYSTLNYKDGLVLTSGGGLVKTWPHVGGIDFAGTVEASSHAGFKAGDKVVLNGYRVGELHWGGYATRARVKGDWLVKLPASLSTKRAMAIGTAGYTSMLCVMALEKHGLKPAAGEVLVTGAAGGVGAFAGVVIGDKRFGQNAAQAGNARNMEECGFGGLNRFQRGECLPRSGHGGGRGGEPFRDGHARQRDGRAGRRSRLGPVARGGHGIRQCRGRPCCREARRRHGVAGRARGRTHPDRRGSSRRDR